MSERLRWGILGTGVIAGKFAGQLDQAGRAVLAAVGSRRQASADKFAKQHGGTALGSYEALLGRDEVDAVYISLPNGMHCEWTIRALEAGKHVLCEKPLASNSAEAAEMFAAAEKTSRILVEAFMYRSQPAVRQAIQLVREGAIGEVRLIRSNFTFCRNARPEDGRYQPNMAGGSLMDVGCYCINFARALAGAEPTSVHAVAHLHELGVDDYAAGTLDFNGNVLATFTSGMTVFSDWRTTVGGSTGYVAIDNPWFSDGKFRVVRGGKSEAIEAPADQGAYALEVDHFAATVQDGSGPVITKDDSLGNMRVLDQLRRQIGLPV